MSLAMLNGSTCTRARVQVPAWGCWWADIDLAEPVALEGTAALVVAGQAMAGKIVSGGVANGRAAYRVVGGAGGWGKPLPKKGYADSAGVRLTTVLGDVARSVGETLAGVPATRLGPNYARVDGPDVIASSVLNLHARQNWYVDFAGVTHIGQRAASTYSGTAPRVRVDPGSLAIELAIDSLAGLLPGVSIDGSLPATDIEFSLDPKRLTARVYAGARRTGRLSAMARMLALLDPGARYRGTYEYRVVLQTGERFALQVVRAASGMPDLESVPTRGPAGIKATVLPGELVLVTFADCDPSRPCIIAHDSPDSPGWMPLFLQLGEDPALGVARQTDPVVAGPFAGTIVLGSLRVKASV